MRTFDQAAPELTLPALDVPALARRLALPAAVAGLAAVAIIVAGGPLHAFSHAFSRALHADPAWVAVAALSEVLSFAGYVALLWLVAGRATSRMGARASAQVALGGAAATRVLPLAGVGGAALTLWALARSGLGSRRATRTLFSFLVLLYSVFLIAVAASGAALSLGLTATHGPAAVGAIPAALATLAIAAALALAVRGGSDRERLAAGARFARLRSGVDLLACGMRDALHLARSGDLRLLGAVAYWGFDAAVLWAVLQAFGAPPALPVVVLAYFVGQTGNTLPIPGAVSAGVTGVLIAFGVPADLALPSVLAYRAVSIWLPAPVGLAALPGLRATVARWSTAGPRA